MNYQLSFTKEAVRSIEQLKKSGNLKLLEKLNELFDELRKHPDTGTGKPEKLRYYREPTWSRRLSRQHRVVYEIHDNVLIVLVLDILGHYDDK